MVEKIREQVEKRRTFAIISHPDAGKTTLTEKLLLFGGAIREAGTVKGKKTGKYAKSDWMDIEKQRGISVTSSVMQLDYDNKIINILDTPGHEDFSEDTYRTLMAVDSAVMVIDGAKGIEAQTLKLFKVCRMRGIPIFTFINKVDREIKDPLELLAEIEEKLEIETYPMNLPVGMGQNFFGIMDRKNHFIEPFKEDSDFVELDEEYNIVDDNPLAQDTMYQKCVEDMILITEAGVDYDYDKQLKGEQTPVFFGSALSSFGVESFLNYYVDNAPTPKGRRGVNEEDIQPIGEDFSGFIFKIQANMDPKHRDRIAFLRVCSGEFNRGMDVNLARTGKKLKISRSTNFMADDKATVDVAYAGDIIGLYDSGNYQIGDTLYQNKKVEFEALPSFTPEIFVKVSAKNVLKQKHFHKGVEQLVQEGAIQYYKTLHTNQIILGAVGQLQFEVFEHRMKNEYNTEVIMERIGQKTTRWIENEESINENMSSSRSILVKDLYDNYVFLFENDFAMNWFSDKYPDVKLFSKL